MERLPIHCCNKEKENSASSTAERKTHVIVHNINVSLITLPEVNICLPFRVIFKSLNVLLIILSLYIMHIP